MDRYCADRILERLVKRAGIEKRISPQSVRHSVITVALDADIPLRDVQVTASNADLRTTMCYDEPAAVSIARNVSRVDLQLPERLDERDRAPTAATSDTEQSGRP